MEFLYIVAWWEYEERYDLHHWTVEARSMVEARNKGRDTFDERFSGKKMIEDWVTLLKRGA